MTIIHFHIEYITQYGQNILLSFIKTKGRSSSDGTMLLQTYDGKNWVGSLPLDDGEKIEYRYACTSSTHTIEEAEGYRTIINMQHHDNIFLKDYWRDASKDENIFFGAAFTDVFFKRKHHSQNQKITSDKNYISFRLSAPDIPKGYQVGVTGKGKNMGDWATPILLQYHEDHRWTGQIEADDKEVYLEYKYVLCNADGHIIAWEEGSNRMTNFNFPMKNNTCLIIHDEGYRHKKHWWKAAGMAIPVFSLRSKSGMGIGEYPDLRHAIDFCYKSGLKVLQTLPINDTIATYTYKDSYPYAAISVYALNPLYINVAAIAKFKNKEDQKAYIEAVEELNNLEEIDLLKVEEYKLAFLKILYRENYKKVFASKKYRDFFRKNKEWIVHYACFCYLRDQHGTSDFNQWGKFSVFKEEYIKELIKKQEEAIGFYYFCQYFADQQLKSVKKYGQEKEVVLKGDLPIGIYRYSCDAWVAPHLYHMDQQAGAPPDGYSVMGQNWGFPTYNWNAMAQDNFLWWQKRMKKLSEYFDALRIDHILGFFRIWQIPMDQIYGTMGLFNPRLPYSRYELSTYGVRGNLDRYTEPFIRDYVLEELFGEKKDIVVNEFLEQPWQGIYVLKEKYKTQQSIEKAFSEKGIFAKHQDLKPGVLHLPTEVLLLKDPDTQEEKYNPRITLHTTYSYQALNDYEKNQFTNLYNHYYYERHNQYWKQQALWKLPALLSASDMLICGEDLGMIPATVPEVMEQLNIIPLEIQRMPKGFTAFAQPAEYNYYTVCSPSCHDMSTIRGWWEGDLDTRQKFWTQYWHKTGNAPEIANTEIVEQIIREHFLSPSIFAIFPLQDLVGMNDKLRKPDASSEQINDPSNSEQYWRYRFHINLEELKEEKALTHIIRSMVKEANR